MAGGESVLRGKPGAGKLNIAALTYSFGTLKTEIGLAALDLHGFRPSLIIAAPPVKLTFYKSLRRVVPRDIPTPAPIDLARHYGATYVETPHDSQTARDWLRKYEIDVAVILGARILKQPLIEAPRIGILNLHPGILPVNRGLDTVKWAVLLDLPQGATAHLIDERIDMGRLVEKKEVAVYWDDTWIDLTLRVQAAEREVMISALTAFRDGHRSFPTLPEDTYRRSVPPEQEIDLDGALMKYKAVNALE